MEGKNRPVDKDVPVWRETPLDHWSRNIDPVIMSGDEWVDESDPGTERFESRVQGDHNLGERFMHPTLDSNYGVEEDVFQDDATGPVE